MSNKIKPPSLFWTSLEGVRASLSAAHLLQDRKFLANLDKGDGHTVMVLPGFMAGDYSTLPIRYFLKQWKYDARAWNLGLNFGLSKRRDLEALMAKQLKQHFARTRRKVSLVGWSLGGVFARELARENPAMVRKVISLGSPIGGNPHGAITGGLYELITQTSFADKALQEKIKTASQPVPDIPCTAIYSKTDGIVSWKIAQEKESSLAENIEIDSAHCGLGLNAAAMFVLADRLRQPEGEWQKFDKTQTERYVYK